MSRNCPDNAKYLTCASYPWPTNSGMVTIAIRPLGWSSGDSTSHNFLCIGDDNHRFEIFHSADNYLYAGWVYIPWSYENRVKMSDAGLFVDGKWTVIGIMWSTGTIDPAYSPNNLFSAAWIATPGGAVNFGAVNRDPAYPLQVYNISGSTLELGINTRTGYGQSGNCEIGPCAVWSDIPASLHPATPEMEAACEGSQLWRLAPHLQLDYWPVLGDESPEPNWSSANPTRSLTVNGSAGKGLSDPNISPFNMGRLFSGNQMLEGGGPTGNFWPFFLRYLNQ